MHIDLILSLNIINAKRSVGNFTQTICICQVLTRKANSLYSLLITVLSDFTSSKLSNDTLTSGFIISDAIDAEQPFKAAFYFFSS